MTPESRAFRAALVRHIDFPGAADAPPSSTPHPGSSEVAPGSFTPEVRRASRRSVAMLAWKRRLANEDDPDLSFGGVFPQPACVSRYVWRRRIRRAVVIFVVAALLASVVLACVVAWGR